MIRKLRKKFILINMTLVTFVLMAVLTALCLFSFHRYRSDSMAAMVKALEMPTNFLNWSLGPRKTDTQEI